MNECNLTFSQHFTILRDKMKKKGSKALYREYERHKESQISFWMSMLKKKTIQVALQKSKSELGRNNLFLTVFEKFSFI